MKSTQLHRIRFIFRELVFGEVSFRLLPPTDASLCAVIESYTVVYGSFFMTWDDFDNERKFNPLPSFTICRTTRNDYESSCSHGYPCFLLLNNTQNREKEM